MCVIVVMKKKIPDIGVFKQCEEKNSHGGGISWVENGSVHFKKGIQYEEMHSIALKKGAPCIAHFRISTVGGVPKELCHPFPVSVRAGLSLEGKAKSVLFHNGHWNGWEKRCMDMILYTGAPFPGGPWSDSRALAWITACSHHTFMYFVTGQRVAIQSADGIVTYGNWDEKEGVYYSNLHWEPVVYFNNSKWGKEYFKGWKETSLGKSVKPESYGGIIYGIDENGKLLESFPKEVTDTTGMTDEELSKHYAQLSEEYEINKE